MPGTSLNAIEEAFLRKFAYDDVTPVSNSKSNKKKGKNQEKVNEPDVPTILPSEKPLNQPQVVVFNDPKQNQTKSFGAKRFLSSKVEKLSANPEKSSTPSKQDEHDTKLDTQLSTLISTSGLLDGANNLDLSFLKTLEQENLSGQDRRRELQSKVLESGAAKTKAQKVPPQIYRGMVKAESERIEKRLELAKDTGLMHRAKSRHGKKNIEVDVVSIAKGVDGVTSHLDASKRSKPSKVIGVMDDALKFKGLVKSKSGGFRAPTEKPGIGRMKGGVLHLSKQDISTVNGKRKRSHGGEKRSAKKQLPIPGMPKRK